MTTHWNTWWLTWIHKWCPVWGWSDGPWRLTWIHEWCPCQEVEAMDRDNSPEYMNGAPVKRLKRWTMMTYLNTWMVPLSEAEAMDHDDLPEYMNGAPVRGWSDGLWRLTWIHEWCPCQRLKRWTVTTHLNTWMEPLSEAEAMDCDNSPEYMNGAPVRGWSDGLWRLTWIHEWCPCQRLKRWWTVTTHLNTWMDAAVRGWSDGPWQLTWIHEWCPCQRLKRWTVTTHVNTWMVPCQRLKRWTMTTHLNTWMVPLSEVEAMDRDDSPEYMNGAPVRGWSDGPWQLTWIHEWCPCQRLKQWTVTTHLNTWMVPLSEAEAMDRDNSPEYMNDASVKGWSDGPWQLTWIQEWCLCQRLKRWTMTTHLNTWMVPFQRLKRWTVTTHLNTWMVPLSEAEAMDRDNSPEYMNGAPIRGWSDGPWQLTWIHEWCPCQRLKRWTVTTNLNTWMMPLSEAEAMDRDNSPEYMNGAPVRGWSDGLWQLT